MRPKTTAKQGYAHCDTQDGNPTHARIDARGGRGLMGKKAMRLGMQEEHAPLDGDTRGGDLAESKTRGHSTWVVAVALIEDARTFNQNRRKARMSRVEICPHKSHRRPSTGSEEQCAKGC